VTYGFRPEDWPLFHSQIEKRRIEVGDIERVEMRPDSIHSSVAITVILRSGRVESWTQDQVENRSSSKRSLIRAAPRLLRGAGAMLGRPTGGAEEPRERDRQSGGPGS